MSEPTRGPEASQRKRSVFKHLISNAMRDPAVKAALALSWRGRGKLACRLASDKRVPIVPKLIISLLVLYLASPIDLVPDFIPVLGQIDDLLVILLAAWAFMKLAPPGIVADIAEGLAAEGYARPPERD